MSEQDKIFADALLSSVLPAGDVQRELFLHEGLLPLLSHDTHDRRIVHDAAALEMARMRCLPPLFSALVAEGVRFLVFKGAALAHQVYTKPWHRTRNDTDLLIEAKDCERAFAVLRAQGFRPEIQLPGNQVMAERGFAKTDEFGATHVIDLHWRLNNNWRLASALSFSDLWCDRQALPDHPEGVVAPSHGFSILIASLHRLAHLRYPAYKLHGFQRMESDFTLWTYDIHLLALRLDADDWQRLLRFTGERGLSAILRSGLERSNDLFGTDVPMEVIKSLSDSTSSIPPEDFATRGGGLRQNLKSLPTWSSRWQFLVQQMFPDAGYMRSQFGAGFLPWLYLRRGVLGLLRRI